MEDDERMAQTARPMTASRAATQPATIRPINGAVSSQTCCLNEVEKRGSHDVRAEPPPNIQTQEQPKSVDELPPS